MKATLLCSLLGLVLLTGCRQEIEVQPSGTNATGKTETLAAPAVSTNGAVSTNAPQATPPATNDTNEVAIIKTSEGDMVIEFWPDVAPQTVASFKKLARNDSYDGTIFHRVVKGFMIQGGDLISKDPAKEAQYGSSNPGFTLPAEFSNRKHTRGVVSMARLGHDINSASSQFFIVLGDASFLDGQYTAFGKLIKGDEVLEKIGNTEVKFYGQERSRPTSRIEIKDVELVPRDKVQ